MASQVGPALAVRTALLVRVVEDVEVVNVVAGKDIGDRFNENFPTPISEKKDTPSREAYKLGLSSSLNSRHRHVACRMKWNAERPLMLQLFSCGVDNDNK